jgi:hypothetical protein
MKVSYQSLAHALQSSDVFSFFELGDFVVLHGDAISFMTSSLAILSQLPTNEDGLGSSVVLIDGGNRFNPYLIAKIAQSYDLDAKSVMKNIFVSRAFTAYQFSFLILEKLEHFLRRKRSKLLVISDITSLFLDEDIPTMEATLLFMKVCAKLSSITSRRELIIMANYFPRKICERSLFFEAILFGRLNVLIKLQEKGQSLSFALEEHHCIDQSIMDFTTDNHVSFSSFVDG